MGTFVIWFNEAAFLLFYCIAFKDASIAFPRNEKKFYRESHKSGSGYNLQFSIISLMFPLIYVMYMIYLGQVLSEKIVKKILYSDLWDTYI